MTRTPRSVHEAILTELLAVSGLSGREPLPDLVRATLQGVDRTAPTRRLHYGSLRSDEVCVRCRRGPHTPRTTAPTNRESHDRVVYWWGLMDQMYINIHLHCLTPDELAWVWAHVGGR